MVRDLALSLALGGDCLADLALLRAELGVYGQVASEATVSRTLSALVGTHKRTVGFHPRLAFADHGNEGTGEPLAVMLCPGNAGSHTADDHVIVARDALAQLPGVNSTWPGKKILIRADGAGAVGTKEFTSWCHRRGVPYSVGFILPGHHPGPAAAHPRARVDPGRRRRRSGPPRSRRGRPDRPAVPDPVATRDAGHRPPGLVGLPVVGSTPETGLPEMLSTRWAERGR